MRFHVITHHFTKAFTRPPRHPLFDLHNPQCRDSHHHHHHHRITPPPTGLSQRPSTICRSYSPKSSNSSMGFIGWYLGMLQSRPILTKCISTSIIFTAADITSQYITMEPNDTWDSIRTLRVAGIGLLIVGSGQHLWFNFMASVLPKSDVISTLKKMGMGFVFGPIINGVFFSINAALQGENGNEIAARLKRDLIPTMINGLMYWSVCDFITYKAIPVQLQPLLNSTFGFMWTIYLTYMASLAKALPD